MPNRPNIRWSHVGLNCRDQQATEEFYTRWLGFRRARVVEADGSRVVFLRHGDVYLELFPTTAGAALDTEADGPQNPGIARHLAFQVDDVDAFLSVDAAGELPVSLGPLTFDEFIPGWKTVWVTDPDGVVVEISQGYTDQAAEELARIA
ncbi:Glyoxalase-like domain containing protein [Actinobacteria bacterium OK074]|nr:Glyoxalase-like domain containing protein [Actinobacteria bacterium OK074]